MTAKECIKGRRSIRKYKDTPVDHALIDEIVETASYSPSWKHSQIARYIAVEGELKDRIARECTQMFPPNGAIIENAPMLIVLTYIKGRFREGRFLHNRKGGFLADVRCRHCISELLPCRI